MRWFLRFCDQHARHVTAAAIVGGLLIAVLDLTIGHVVSVRLGYLPFLVATAWVGGRRLGLTFVAAYSLIFLVHPFVREDSLTLSGAIWEMAVRLISFSVIVLLLDHLRGAIQRERELAQNDHLTGMLNARGFRAALSAEQNRNHRFGDPLTLVAIDGDNFKAVNDTCGHQIGDQLLVETAECLRETTRNYDSVARLGGDEFAILLPKTATEDAASVVRRVHELLTSRMQSAGWPVTYSVGAVTFSGVAPSVDEMLRLADEQMYAAKRAGKDRISYFEVAPYDDEDILEMVETGS